MADLYGEEVGEVFPPKRPPALICTIRLMLYCTKYTYKGAKYYDHGRMRDMANSTTIAVPLKNFVHCIYGPANPPVRCGQ